MDCVRLVPEWDEQIRLGKNAEVFKTLRAICIESSPSVDPSNSFQRGLWQLRIGKPARALEDFSQFLRGQSDPYWQRLAQMMSLACLIQLREIAKAEELVSQLALVKAQFSPLVQDLLGELEGQILFYSGAVALAHHHFRKLASRLSQPQNSNLIYAEKWIVVCELVIQGWKGTEKSFLALRSKALADGHTDIVRDLDLFRKAG